MEKKITPVSFKEYWKVNKSVIVAKWEDEDLIRTKHNNDIDTYINYQANRLEDSEFILTTSDDINEIRADLKFWLKIKTCHIYGCNKEACSPFHSVCYDHKQSI